MTSFSLFDKKGEFFAVLHCKYFVSAQSLENFASGFSLSVIGVKKQLFNFSVEALLVKQKTKIKKPNKRRIDSKRMILKQKCKKTTSNLTK
jgi:dipeptide/tripeptide permease